MMRGIISKPHYNFYLTAYSLSLKNYFMNKTGKIITAFTIGSAAGAFLGLLMASDKKKEAIKKMKEEKKLFSDDARSKYLKGKVSELV